MTRQKQNRDKLQALLDTIEDSILRADDEEILEDIALEGRDPEQAAEDIKNLISQSIKSHNRKKLKAAQKGYRRAISARAQRVVDLPDLPDEKRALLHSIIADRNNIPAEITMAFRDGDHMSDDDVSSVLDDLAALGFLDNGED